MLDHHKLNALHTAHWHRIRHELDQPLTPSDAILLSEMSKRCLSMAAAYVGAALNVSNAFTAEQTKAMGKELSEALHRAASQWVIDKQTAVLSDRKARHDQHETAN